MARLGVTGDVLTCVYQTQFTNTSRLYSSRFVIAEQFHFPTRTTSNVLLFRRLMRTYNSLVSAELKRQVLAPLSHVFLRMGFTILTHQTHTSVEFVNTLFNLDFTVSLIVFSLCFLKSNKELILTNKLQQNVSLLFLNRQTD